MRKGCTLVVKIMWSKYSQWRSFSETKPVPCTNSFRKNDCPYWLVVWPICLYFMLCFLLVLLYCYSSIVSHYSTGPQHNMGCKYRFEYDLFVSFYWYIYSLGYRQLVETDFRRAPSVYGWFDQETMINSLTDV